MSTEGPQILVAGLGNVLMGDDAFGPYVVRALEAGHELPEGVVARDLGTPGLDLAPYLSGVEVLIVVDTVHADGAPGEIRLYRREEVLEHSPSPRLSPHDPGLKEALLRADLEGRGPREVLLVGVIPESTGMGLGLSPAVRDAVAGARGEILRELARLGVPATARTDPSAPDIWWEAQPRPAGA